MHCASDYVISDESQVESINFISCVGTKRTLRLPL